MRLFLIILGATLIGLANVALAQSCPPNSHSTGSGCACDAGYVNRGGQCVPK
jgi:hypothetical protein